LPGDDIVAGLHFVRILVDFPLYLAMSSREAVSMRPASTIAPISSAIQPKDDCESVVIWRGEPRIRTSSQLAHR
jgi:hypothetical protein